MTKFRIDYVDPKTGQPASETVEREDDPVYPVLDKRGNLIRTCLWTAKDQVWDYAYVMTNKGTFEVTELDD